MATIRESDGATDMTSLYRSVRAGLAPAAKSLLLRSGALRALRAVRPSDGLAILRYHAICGPEGYAYASPDICISPEAFESHARYLAANYNVLGLPDAVKAIREGASLPPNAVAITFDDGYADNLEAARTLLGAPGEASWVEVKLRQPSRLQAAKSALAERLGRSWGSWTCWSRTRTCCER